MRVPWELSEEREMAQAEFSVSPILSSQKLPALMMDKERPGEYGCRDKDRSRIEVTRSAGEQVARTFPEER